MNESMSNVAVILLGIVIGILASDMYLDQRKKQGRDRGGSLKYAAGIGAAVFLVAYIVTSK